MQLPRGRAGLERALSSPDAVEGEQGREYEVPTFEEVEQAAADKIRGGD